MMQGPMRVPSVTVGACCARMTAASGFLKISTYHDILGPRMRWWVIDRMRKGIFKEFSDPQALQVLYAVLGLDPASSIPPTGYRGTGLVPSYNFGRMARRAPGWR